MIHNDENFTDALYEFLDQGWVETSCHFCEPVRIVSREAVLEIFPPTSKPLYINQLNCPFTRMKIGNRIYERLPETSQHCNCLYCHDCGTEEGNIHHIHCKLEICPRCRKESCNCLVKRYYLPGVRRGIKAQTLPPKVLERRLYSQNREAGLKTFIEHRLHDHNFMAKTSIGQLKEMAQKFDKHRDMETFEEVWRNVLEFKDRSDKAFREFGQKIRPSNVKWTRKDKVALK
ncbi:MAG: hypothetical protein WBZ36_05010 [Candidatus Nitrosopolaris sp.]|jgi:hypothetical protein